jgi:hypothetical protein
MTSPRAVAHAFSAVRIAVRTCACVEPGAKVAVTVSLPAPSGRPPSLTYVKP